MKTVTREFYGNRHKQDDRTKRLMSKSIAWQIAVFEAYGGEIQCIQDGVSGAKPWKPKRVNYGKSGHPGSKTDQKADQ